VVIATIATAFAASGWLAAIALGIAWFRAHDAAEIATVRLEAMERHR
jgi:hypothetical protein